MALTRDDFESLAEAFPQVHRCEPLYTNFTHMPEDGQWHVVLPGVPPQVLMRTRDWNSVQAAFRDSSTCVSSFLWTFHVDLQCTLCGTGTPGNNIHSDHFHSKQHCKNVCHYLTHHLQAVPGSRPMYQEWVFAVGRLRMDVITSEVQCLRWPWDAGIRLDSVLQLPMSECWFRVSSDMVVRQASEHELMKVQWPHTDGRSRRAYSVLRICSLLLF